MSRRCVLRGMPGASASCDGKLRRCHLIPKQVLKTEVWSERADVRRARRIAVEARGGTWPAQLLDLLWDPRTWVWGCGGPMGNGGHHGQLDQSRRLKIPRHRLPVEVEEFASEFGLLWWLDREYGTKEETDGRTEQAG